MDVLDIDAEQALFDGQIQGLVISTFQNERPLAGLAGWFDWRFGGIISHAIRAGAVSGLPGECVYVPVTRADRTYHLLLVGAGLSEVPGERKGLPPESFKTLQKNLATLRISKIGISRRELGGGTLGKGVPLCVVR